MNNTGIVNTNSLFYCEFYQILKKHKSLLFNLIKITKKHRKNYGLCNIIFAEHKQISEEKSFVLLIEYI